MMGILNKHQLKFNSIKDAKKLLEAVKKRFGRNGATKKTQRNLLKQQYENFTALSLEMLDQTFDRLQKLRNNADLDTMSMDDLYNNLKLHEPKVNEMSSSSSSTQNLAFVSSSNNNTSSTNIVVNTAQAVNTTHGVSTASYKMGLESVEERLKFYKTNESIYLEDIKVLKVEIQIGEIAIRELRKKLEIAQKEKDGIHLNVDKFEHASKSLNKLIECQIVDNYKKGLGYENYNAVPPPYTGNFIPPTPHLSFTGLDEFVNKHVVENYKAKSSEEEPMVVRKNDDALIIEEWVLDNEEEDVSQPKIKKKTFRPSIAKIEFVKSKKQKKYARKIVKLVEQHRQNTHSPRGSKKSEQYDVLKTRKQF
nr:ribonuclease H-like domain-containing protein [Tanacetum cinerariifolium]